jgi:hypothetical protein
MTTAEDKSIDPKVLGLAGAGFTTTAVLGIHYGLKNKKNTRDRLKRDCRHLLTLTNSLFFGPPRDPLTSEVGIHIILHFCLKRGQMPTRVRMQGRPESYNREGR